MGERTLRFYVDECVPATIARALSEHGHGVLIATECGHRGKAWTDEKQLEFAAENGRVLVSTNRRDFRREHGRRQSQQLPHAGILLLSAKKRPDAVAVKLLEFLDNLTESLADKCITVSMGPD